MPFSAGLELEMCIHFGLQVAAAPGTFDPKTGQIQPRVRDRMSAHSARSGEQVGAP